MMECSKAAQIEVLKAQQAIQGKTIDSLTAELKALNITVTEISAGVRVFRWLFSACVALGPMLGVALAKFVA